MNLICFVILGSRIKLKRPKALIERNLQTLKANNRKELAQRLYYNGGNAHKNNLITERKKRPVHQRLGLKHQMPLGTSTNFIIQKKKTNQPNKQSFTLNAKRMQRFSVQPRLDKFKPQQAVQPGIKLRRLTTAKNLTIHLKNSDFTSMPDSIKRFRMDLNPKIQAEILEIQTENKSHEISFVPTLVIKPATTGISFSDRFGNL